MKISQITNSFSKKMGGAEKLVNMIHCHLREKDIPSFLLGILMDNENTLPDSYSIGLKTPYDIRAFLFIKNYLKNNVGSDGIVHTHLFPTNLYCAILKRLGYIKGKLITTEHNTFNRRRGKMWGRIIDCFIFNSYDHIITVSEGTKSAMEVWVPQVRNKISVIQNGIILSFKKKITRDKKEGTITILSVGSLTKQKNYSNALISLSSIKKLDFKWLIAGEGVQKKQLIIQRDNLGLRGKVKFLGRVDPILPLLEKADIFLIPSLWEGLSLAAVEAMNASLPLVASDVPGLSEVVKTNPQCALLIDPLVPESIASSVKKLINSYDLRLKMGLRAFDRGQEFNEKKMVNQYLNIYKKLIK